jgi:hypothetical protein
MKQEDGADGVIPGCTWSASWRRGGGCWDKVDTFQPEALRLQGFSFLKE